MLILMKFGAIKGSDHPKTNQTLWLFLGIDSYLNRYIAVDYQSCQNHSDTFHSYQLRVIGEHILTFFSPELEHATQADNQKLV